MENYFYTNISETHTKILNKFDTSSSATGYSYLLPCNGLLLSYVLCLLLSFVVILRHLVLNLE